MIHLTTTYTPAVQPPTTLDNGIEIIYQDEFLLVANKPADMLSVPGRGPDKQDCLISRVQQVYPNARTVHRLDMATSGLIIIALSHDSQRALSKMFEQRLVDKTYQALVYGLITQKDGKVDLPLICDWPNRPRQKVCHDSGKPSQTEYQVISLNKEMHYTRISLHPITGRSHQLRVHMQALGHPILGDYFYAEKDALAASKRLCLHAQKLSFMHPFTEEKIQLTSEPDF